VAAGMKGHGTIELRTALGKVHLQVFHQELGKLKGPLPDGTGFLEFKRVIVKQPGVVDADHGGAGARWRDDRTLRVAEYFQEVPCHGKGLIKVARVEQGLAAASLFRGTADLDTEPLEYACRGRHRFRIESVGKTGYEQGRFHESLTTGVRRIKYHPGMLFCHEKQHSTPHRSFPPS